MDEREARFRQLTEQFPDSPLGFFSLGSLQLEAGRCEEALAQLSKAVALDSTYAAAWMALGDAQARVGQTEAARGSYARALATPLGQRDVSFQTDVEARLSEL